MSILVSSPNLAKVSTKVSSLSSIVDDHDGENRRKDKKIAGESQRYDFVMSLYNFFYAIVANDGQFVKKIMARVRRHDEMIL